MTYNIRFLPEVEEDLFAGFSWYEDKARGLGEEFLRIFYASSNYLTRNALIYKKVYGDFCRLLLRRFPYAIYFLIDNNEVIILGLFHCARDPRTIKNKLSTRSKNN
jgi:hypothetical protein